MSNMKWKFYCLVIYFLMISNVENAENFSFPGIVNSITSQLADMFLTPRKYVERKKIAMNTDIILNETTSTTTQSTTVVDAALLGPGNTWANWRFISTRIVPAKRTTTEETLVNVEQSEEVEETRDYSDTYDDVLGTK